MKTMPLILISGSVLIIATASPAADNIWRWVDEDGVLTFSSSKPPVGSRDITLIHSRAEDGSTRMKNGGPDANRRSREASTDRRRIHPPSYPDTTGEVPVSDYQRQYENYREAGEGDCCVHYRDYDVFDSYYTPYTDYAYSRRRHAKRLHAYRPHYGRHFYRHYHKRNLFGYRRYDRHYYGNSYRYHSRVPRFHHYGKKHHYREDYGKKHIYRGDYGKRHHRGSYFGKRRGSAYHGGRHYRGGHHRSGHAGYRGGSGYRLRR